jgi:hypothetical protein
MEILGDFKEFRSAFVVPIQKSFVARRALLPKLNSTINASGKVFVTNVDVSAEGLNLLRKLHKQVA